MDESRWPYNSVQWRKLRRIVIAEEPLCRYCKEVNRITPSVIADHIKPVKDYPELAFVRDNLQGLCVTCHGSIKAREDRTGKRIGCDKNGIPFGGWE